MRDLLIGVGLAVGLTLTATGFLLYAARRPQGEEETMIALAVFVLLIRLAIVAAIIWVIVHFVRKWW